MVTLKAEDASSKVALVLFTIHRATLADEVGIQEVIKAVYDEYGFTWDPGAYHADLYDLESYYFNPGHLFLVAKSEDGRIVGTGSLETFPTIPTHGSNAYEVEGTIRIGGCDCAVNRVYVDPNTRRAGIARRLMNDIIAEARRRECRRMEIWSDKRFEAAHQLYYDFGAVQAGERICNDPDVSPEWGLYLDL